MFILNTLHGSLDLIRRCFRVDLEKQSGCMKHNRHGLTSIIAILVIVHANAADGQIQSAAVTNLPAPGVGSGAIIQNICEYLSAQPALNNSRQFAFTGEMQIGLGGVNSSNDTGIWSSGGSGALSLVAREGSPAPDVPDGAVFSYFRTDPLLNDAGEVAFVARLRTGAGGVTASNDEAVWSQRNGRLSLFAREGSQAPGASVGANFDRFFASTYANSYIAFNNQGQTVVNASLVSGVAGITDDNDTGLWSDPQGVLTLVLLEGAQAPGLPVGAVFDDFGPPWTSPVLNSAGQVAVRANLRTGTGGVVSSNDSGIWFGDPGAMGLVVREGDAAHGVPPGSYFSGFGEATINDVGGLLFRGSLRRGLGGVTVDNDDGLWTTRKGDALELLAREGEQVSGAAFGINYGAFYYYALNNEGQSASTGYLQLGSGGVTSENDAVVFAELSGSLGILAREGDYAPGTFNGEVFSAFDSPMLNSAGQLAFYGKLKTGIADVTSSNDEGIWAQDIFGSLKLIVREGDLLEVNPGEFATINNLQFHGYTGNGDGQRSIFNDRGELAFWAQAGSSNGVFISDSVTTPFSAADFNDNYLVEAEDLARWQSAFGMSVGAIHGMGDADYNGAVNGSDFLTWQRQYGSLGASGASAQVPETSTFQLLLCVGFVMAGVRRFGVDRCLGLR